MLSCWHVKPKFQLTQSLNYVQTLDAFHGLDHAYIFTEGYSSNNQIEFTPEDYKLADQLTTLITNFVKHG